MIIHVYNINTGRTQFVYNEKKCSSQFIYYKYAVIDLIQPVSSSVWCIFA